MKDLVSLKSFLSRLQQVAEVMVPDPSGTAEHIALIAGEYVRLGMRLPQGHAWRSGKGRDSFSGLQDVDVLAEKLGLSSRLTALLYLMTFSADIGRIIIALEHAVGNKRRSQAEHGQTSVEVLERLGIFQNFGKPLSEAVATAITHHSDIKTPTLEDLDNNKIAWALCCLLRDLDKLSIISGKAFLYVEHPEERQRQVVANKLKMEYVVTTEILEQFERGEPIDRLKCETFVDWLLQFLAWRGDFNFQELWDMAVESRGYYFVLRWIKKYCWYYHKEQCERILTAAEEQYGLYYADLD